jgi:hypothetical protein
MNKFKKGYLTFFIIPFFQTKPSNQQRFKADMKRMRFETVQGHLYVVFDLISIVRNCPQSTQYYIAEAQTGPG